MRDPRFSDEASAGPIFDSYPAPTLLLDSHLRVVTMNKAARAMLAGEAGATPLLIDRVGNVLECAHACAPGGCGRTESCGGCVILGSVHQAFTTGPVRRASASIRVCREGCETVVPLLVSASPVRQGGETRIVLTLEDVSDFVRLKDDVTRAQDALRYERDLTRSVAQNAAEAIFVTDEAGRVTFANREAERVFGFTSEELRGRSLHDAIHHHRPDGQPYPGRDCPRGIVYRRGETVRDQEDVFYRKDGTPVEVSCSSAPLELGGKRVGAVLIVRDLTDIKRAEKALRQSEQRFRALIENSTDLIFVLDENARITFWSPSATEALGWVPEDVLGRSRYDIVHPDDHRILADALASARSRPGPTARVTMRTRHKNGSWILIESEGRNLLSDPAVHGIVVNSRDVTAQRRLEEQLQQAQKLESIGRLAGGVAHDFNNLLTVILSGTQALEEELGERSGNVKELIEEIGGAGMRARDLTRQLLAFARRQVIDPVPLQLDGQLRNSEKLLRRVLGEDIELVTSLQPDLWTVRFDPGQLEQVILNLAVNARDAMPSGGRLVIETSNIVVDERSGALFPEIEPGSYVRLAVHDTGNGMPPEVRTRVFEPFFTTKPVGKGTGLGLATVYGIVCQNGGFIRVESEPKYGTTFEMVFPRVIDVAPAVEAPPAPSAEHGTGTVLIVEDDPHVREITVRSLRGAGYAVVAARDGHEALDISGRERGRLDLLVTDVVMPGIDGRAVAEKVRQQHPEVRVLYVSGHAEEAIVHRGVLECRFPRSSVIHRPRLAGLAPRRELDAGAGAR